MKSFLPWCYLCVVVALTAVAASGQEISLLFRDGTHLVGKVQQCTDEVVKFQYRTEHGEEVGTFAVADLDPASYYAIRRETVGEDGTAHLNLAIYCGENGLVAAAYAHYQRAKALAPDVVERFDKTEKQALLEKIAARLLDDARKAMAERDFERAESLVGNLILYLGETKAADEARHVVKEIGEKRLQETLAKSSRPGAAMVTLLMRDGRSIEGELVESTDDSVKLKIGPAGSETVVGVPAQRIDAHSFVKIRAQALGDDARAHLALARYCFDNDLMTQCYFFYDRAKTIDPTLVAQFEKEQLPRVQEQMAAQSIAAAEKALWKGNLAEAGRRLSMVLIRLPDTSSAARARELLDELDREFTRKLETRYATDIEKLDEQGKKEERARQDLVNPIRRELEAARKLEHEALKNSKQSQARRQFETAAARYDAAMKKADELAKKHSPDARVMALIEPLRAEAAQGAVDAYVNAGSLLLTLGSYEAATDAARQALAIDPGNVQAQGFLARVEAAVAAAAAAKRYAGPARR
ncbi:MAG: hypothetical protein AB1486_26865 [Planctomycetota bacterium]